MSLVDHPFDERTERHAAPTLQRIRDFARTTPLEGPIAIEVGSNRGRFLAAEAARHPDTTYLGIELRRKFATQAQKRLHRKQLTNAHVLCADANLVVPIVAKPEQVCAFYLICPDPWWKTRHEKRRILQPSFLTVLANRMANLAPLYIRTDVAMLAEWMHEALDQHPDFHPLPLSQYPDPPLPLSTRERHITDFGLPIFPVYYRRALRTA